MYEQRKLLVVNPDTGKEFTISLWDWHRCLWGVRVHPTVREPSDKDNPFVQCHRLLPRPAIEEWLERLQMVPARTPRRQSRQIQA